MSTTKKPIIHVDAADIVNCSFSIPYTSETKPKMDRNYFFINTPASTEEVDFRLGSDADEYHRGWIVVKHTLDRHWYAADGVVRIVHEDIPTRRRYRVRGKFSDDGCHEIAFGIDPRMRREDIDGATHIYLNEKKDGWLFAHATVEEHHDRIFAAEVAMSTVFDEVLHDHLTKVLVKMISGSTSEQRGAATILEHIENFRNDCKKIVRYNEIQLHIGAHIREPEEHYIYKMVERAYMDTKKFWQKDPKKKVIFNQIGDHLTAIETRLTSRATFKNRWETVVFQTQQSDTESE